MFFGRSVILLCLFVFWVSQCAPSENSTSTGKVTDATNFTEENVTQTYIDYTDTNSTSVDYVIVSDSGNVSGENATKSSTGHDIEITGWTTPQKDVLNKSTEPPQTVLFESTSVITTTDKEEVLSVCSLKPCKNNGTCVEDETDPFIFTCMCPKGFVGIRCGTVDSCVMNKDEQLCRNGACVFSQDGLTRSCQCFPGKYWDAVKRKCRSADPQCFPNPCMNGGVCYEKNDVVRCNCSSGYTGKNCSVLNKCGSCKNGTCVLDGKQTTKYCKCNDGLYWDDKKQSCKIMTSPCDLRPCQNGGICDVESEHEYNCTCANGFSGDACEITENCSTDEDCGHGVCTLLEHQKTKSCRCNNGFYLEDHSHTCKEVTNACQPNPCLNDGICVVSPETDYVCICSFGYLGKICNIRDLCEMDGGNAYCGNGTCEYNKEMDIYYCSCKENEYFRYTERKCVELDLCPLIKCGNKQTCLMGQCICEDNYKKIDEMSECEPDFCSSNPCPLEEMICEEGTGATDYKCHCREGFSFNGTHCNEASCVFPDLNPCNQFCSTNDDGFECNCYEGFEMKEDNNTCNYVGNSTCSNTNCDKGVCIQKDNMEACLCNLGFTEVDGTCKDVCSAGQLTPGICPSDQCELTTHNGFFRCKCEGKFAYSKDGVTCMVRNVCDENETGWKTCSQKNAECIVDWLSEGGFQCRCREGQTLTDGGTCKSICSIEINQRQCSIKRAICDLDTNGTMICKCPPYFKENERDRRCTQPAAFSYLITLPLDKSTYGKGNRKPRSLSAAIDYRRISYDTTITVREMFRSFTQANVLSCKPESDYILCKIELQFDADSETELKRMQTENLCVTHENSNACLLPPSLVLLKNKISEKVYIQLMDPCDEDIKELVCGSDTTCVSSVSQKSFNCSCRPGYLPRQKVYPFGNTRSFIEMCSDIDECAISDPCPANSNCMNTIGSYSCTCKPGYRKVTDSSGGHKCLELCNPSPCTHGQCLPRGDSSFDCKCDAGYAGSLCNLQDEHFKRAKTNTIIVGVVLGGALLITFILFAACISRLRKKKILENTGNMFYNTTEMAERRRGDGGAINNAYQRE